MSLNKNQLAKDMRDAKKIRPTKVKRVQQRCRKSNKPMRFKDK